MKGLNTVEGDFGFFSSQRFGEALSIRFKENLLDHLANLNKRNAFEEYASKVSDSGNIKVVILQSEPEKCGCEEYAKFFLKQKYQWDKTDVYRLCNVINQVILGIVNLRQIVIHVGKGNVISLFMNIGLACDYRIAANNTVFCNPYLDLGLIPKGGGAFFLSRLMGPGKAYEVLLLNKEISAHRAFELGIVDRIVPPADLDTTALEIAHEFCRNHARTIESVKRLLNYSMEDLKYYLEFENQEIFKIVNASDFGNGPNS